MPHSKTAPPFPPCPPEWSQRQRGSGNRPSRPLDAAELNQRIVPRVIGEKASHECSYREALVRRLVTAPGLNRAGRRASESGGVPVVTCSFHDQRVSQEMAPVKTDPVRGPERKGAGGRVCGTSQGLYCRVTNRQGPLQLEVYVLGRHCGRSGCVKLGLHLHQDKVGLGIGGQNIRAWCSLSQKGCTGS